MTLFNIKFHNKNDKDILEWLDRQDNKAGSLKDPIREQIKREGN